MKKIAVIWLILLNQSAFAQQRQVNTSEIDDRAKSIDFASPAALADALTSNYTTEREKLRSIFTWITDHIAYRVKKNYRTISAGNHNTRLMATDTAWQSGNDFMATTVLQNRTAVCDGYARLFKSLCDHAGLRSAIITGFANGDFNRRATFRCNHTWNAVFIDSSWQLLDLTWASGYTNYSGDEFIKRYDETYFLATPQDFIRDHFPDDLRWTLMEKPSFPEEFTKAPYRNKSFSKYKIISYWPASGIIEAAVGDTVTITLETSDALADSKVAADTMPAFDTLLQKTNSSVALVAAAAGSNNTQLVRYQFFVASQSVEWLQLRYNDDTVLRYRLKVKKDKNSQANNSSMSPPLLAARP